MTYKIEAIEGVGPTFAKQLEVAGIMTTEDLLKHGGTPEGRKHIATRTGLSESQILKWVNLADLMRVKGVGSEYSELLEAAGVDTVKELATRNPANLTSRLEQVNGEKKLTRATPPSKMVESWIEEAGRMPAMVGH